MYKLILPAFLFLSTLLTSAWTAPDRESFAKEDRPIEGVPVNAFELGDGNLTIEGNDAFCQSLVDAFVASIAVLGAVTTSENKDDC